MGSLFRFFLFGILVGAVIFPIYALASSNSGSPVGGEGAGTISGWEVSNIKYLPSSDPSRIASVEFDLNSPARTASVKLESDGAIYYQCTNTNALHWQCDLAGGVGMAGVDELRVIASD